MSRDDHAPSFEAVLQSFETGDYDSGMDALTEHLSEHGPLSPENQAALHDELAVSLIQGALRIIAGDEEVLEAGRRLDQAANLGKPIQDILTMVEDAGPDDGANLRWRRRVSATLQHWALSLGDRRALPIAEAISRLDPASDAIWLELGASALASGEPELAEGCFARFRHVEPDEPHRIIPIVQVCLTQNDPERALAHLPDPNADIPASLALELGVICLLAELDESGLPLFARGTRDSPPDEYLAAIFSLTAIDLDLVDEALAELPDEKAGVHYFLARAHRLIIQGDMVSAARWLHQAELELSGYSGPDAEDLRTLCGLLRSGLTGYEDEELVQLVAFSGKSLERTHAWLDRLRSS